MYEYTVPQEFNQNDRIGNFTIPQAFIMGGGVLLIMLLMSSGINILLALVLDVPIAVLTIYLMYKKKYDIPIYEFAMIYIMYKATPKLLIYRKENVREEFVQDEIMFIEKENDELSITMNKNK